MSKLFLGIDQGTYSSRALLFDEQGTQVACAYEPVTLQRFDGGRVEQDANKLVSTVKHVIDAVLREYNKNNDIVACGIATQRSTVLSWTSDGVANGPALSWQDVRGSEQVKNLHHDSDKIQIISGLPLSAHYGASKMRWLLDNLPMPISSTTDNFLSPMVSFLLFHLIENKPYQVDSSNAQRTQLMDLKALDWSGFLAECFGVPENMLPACVPVCADYGVLTDHGVPVKAVCGDQNAAMLGAGELSTNTAMINLGSGAFILKPLSRYKASKNQLTSISVSRDGTVQYIREATINGAGSAINWLGKKYDIKLKPEQLNDWLKTVEHPPLFINSVGGLGSPWWRQDIQSEFIDADFNDERAMVVAVVESIIFMLRANLDYMTKEDPVEYLRVSGGLSVSDALCQKLANLCDLPVERVDNPEATARGVAWLAAGCPDEWNSTISKEIFEPVVDNALNGRCAQYMRVLNKKLTVGA